MVREEDVKTLHILLAAFLLMSRLAQAETLQLSAIEIDEAEKSPIYQKYDLVCKVCSAIEEKQAFELSLKNDMRYAKKYGVINYGRRDRFVQGIKHDDLVINNGKSEYKQKYKHRFPEKECDLVNTEDCEGALFELSGKILGKISWEVDDVYPKP